MLSALLASACFETQGGPMPRQGGTMYVALDSDPTSLNPLVDGDPTSVRAYTPLWPLLYAVHGDFTVIPQLAADMPAIGDKGATLTVSLNGAAKWSDNTPITADDVVYTVSTEMNAALDTRTHFDWSPLKAIAKVDDHTVRFTLSRADATFIADHLVTPIVPKHVYGKVDPSQMSGAAASNQPMVSGGPFRFDHRAAGQSITLLANAGYFGGRPHPDQLVFVVAPKAAMLPTQLAEGKVSWAPVLPPDVASQAVITSGVTVRSYPDTMVVGIQFNVRTGRVFADASVRQAFAYSVDHDAIVIQASGAAQAYPVWSDLYPNSWAYADNAVTKYIRDIGHAQQLLHAAGWGSGAGGVATKGGQRLAAQLIFPSSDATRAMAATLLSTQAHDAGFALTATGLGDADFTAAVGAGNFDAAVIALPVRLDPDDSALLHSGGTENRGGYANPMLDGLLDGEVAATPANGQTAQQIRVPVFMQVEQVVSRDLPVYFLWAPRQFTAFSATLGGVAGTGAELDHDRSNTFYVDWYLIG